MKAIYSALLIAVFLLPACKSTKGDTAKASRAEQQRVASQPASQSASRPASRPLTKTGWQSDALGRYQVFGAGLAAESPERVVGEDFVSNIKDYEGKTVRVMGVVASTCKKKGCWMNVEIGDSGRIFVKFKDYKFFVPKEGAEGRRVIFEGVASEKKQTIEEMKHYLEDAGDFEAAKKVTAPTTIPFIMATGVRMYALR